MYITDNQGNSIAFNREHLLNHIKHFCYSLSSDVDPQKVVDRVEQGSYDGITTRQIATLSAESAAYLTSFDPDYLLLGGRIGMNLLHKNTSSSFSSTVHRMYNYVSPITREPAPLVSEQLYQIVMDNAEYLDNVLDYNRDFEYDFFGFKTLEKSYLLKLDNQIVERPQQMLLRVSLGIHANDLKSAIQTYNLMSEKWFTHASPTLFNSGTPRPQLSSCFLVSMKDDSIEGIYDTLKTCAMISKSAGGIGVNVQNIRAAGSYIRGTNGISNGLVPMLRVFNDTARYVDQGGGKRKGAFAIYIEPWHSDIFEVLELKKNNGKDEIRARDLFYALWVSDLFMKRVKTNAAWSLFCPNEAPGLSDVWGEEFEQLYLKYEREGRAHKTVKARELWFAILESQVETGTPYILYKDACNAKSNQQHLGTIKGSNLCTEIVEYTSKDEVAVCNLASIALPKFVDYENRTFDHQKLYDVVKVIINNLNRVIDVNYYPVKEARNSNMKHRPIGVGVQGLADTFFKMHTAYDSNEARKVNKEIFETIYFAALTASNEIAQKEGTFASYEGSPISKGILQFDMWNVKPDSGRWDWDTLRNRIKEHGVRNSLLVAPMPTASTSQILGNSEGFEPYTSNMFTRRVLAGEFPLLNKYMVRDLKELGLWDRQTREQIIANNGSIQHLPKIPTNIRDIYRTVWEIKQRSLIDMAADRGAFIDQSQSFSVFMPQPTKAKLTSMHFYGWERGLKTGMYYLRARPAADAIKFTVDQSVLKQTADEKSDTDSGTTFSPSKQPSKQQSKHPEQQRVQAKTAPSCSMEDGCLMCGS
eukprot:gb/GECH01014221.1/.p1 GENE.gb/GECH01014221.1/~~gb/GECH01014221.1/.p1  ORF type:complete len:813 (+),score=172.54 gb/GECH01014221.1/:1-2439(+)